MMLRFESIIRVSSTRWINDSKGSGFLDMVDTWSALLTLFGHLFFTKAALTGFVFKDFMHKVLFSVKVYD